MTDTQKPAPKGPNGTATRLTGSDGVERDSQGVDGAGSNNRPNGAKSTTPQKNPPAGNGDKDAGTVGKSAKKRRKVNHACIYCRRSHMTCDLERPCTRCVKRNIGHLCHDEPREPAKKSKSELNVGAENEPPSKLDHIGGDASMGPLEPARQDTGLGLSQLSQGRGTASLRQPTPVAAQQSSSLTGNNQSMLGFNDWNFNPQSNFLHDMHSFHPSYSFGTSEVSNEYNLLNEFLTHSMLEDGGMYPNDDASNLFQSDTSFPNTMQTLNNNLFTPGNQTNQPNQMPPPSQNAIGNALSRPASAFPLDKARENFYMTAADPAGNESASARMKKLMEAKHKAGLLMPFNYVKGYARLNEYMNRHLHAQSRLRIVRQVDSFRPKFRERMQHLTDYQLVIVEIEFEKKLMEYDRVFASMAIPACCWRRTGEIYRGNHEMAKLLGVSIDQLRDGKIAIHEVFAETSLVSYWEKFGAIAFDMGQKAILTSCTLRKRDEQGQGQATEIRCCFSFTIRRDSNQVPSLIVGNFLPIKPAEK